jgi:hypothetical protein
MGYKFFDVEISDAQLLPLSHNSSSLNNSKSHNDKENENQKEEYDDDDDDETDEENDQEGLNVEMSSRSLLKSKAKSNRGWNLDQNDKMFLHFDLDNYKQIRTEPIEYPWKWSGYIQRTLYATQWHNLLAEKSMKIYCTRFRKWRVSDEIVACAEIDLLTLVTGPKLYEVQLLHPSHRYPICAAHFHFSMIQVVQDITIKLRKLDITSAYNHLQPMLKSHSTTTINVFCGYIDPMQQQWQLKYFPMNFNSLNETTKSVVIRELKIKLPLYILGSNFLKGSLHIVFLKQTVGENNDKENKNESGDDSDDNNEEESEKALSSKQMSEELGRVVIPILGNYDSERQHLPVKEFILWKPQNKNKNHNNNDVVHGTLSFQNGPKWVQLQNALYSSQKGIRGDYFIGFPTPLLNDIDIHLKALDIEPFIQSHALCMGQLKFANYGEEFPDWFLHRKPNDKLLENYDYDLLFEEEEKEVELKQEQKNESKEAEPNNKNNNNAIVYPPHIIIPHRRDDALKLLITKCDVELKKQKANRWHLLQMYEQSHLSIEEYAFACESLESQHKEVLRELQTKFQQELGVLLQC